MKSFAPLSYSLYVLAIIPHLQRLGRIIHERSAAAGRLGDAGVELRAGRIATRRETRQMGDNRKKSRISLVGDPAPGRCPFGDKKPGASAPKEKKSKRGPNPRPCALVSPY